MSSSHPRPATPRCGSEHPVHAGPFDSNPLRTREDMHRAIVALCSPLESRRSAGGARIRMVGPQASYTDTCREMEGFSRMLWGLAPLLAGGGTYAFTARACEGLINGCDPRHPEYWGAAADHDQRLVECAAIAFAIVLSPDAFWIPLSPAQRANVVRFLAAINEREVRDNNWRFFRVLVNLMLARCGAPFSSRQLQADLDRIDSFYLGDGWYADGCNRAVDYYAAFGMHFYGLICAGVMREIDDARASTLVERASAFAREFMYWFSPDGSAIPYGRSLTYRFAQAAFWSALAFAGVEAAPWGVTKGLVLRNLRWWGRQPLLSDGAFLSIGYAYGNQAVADRYSSACSPYWALKAFLPAALPPHAPFWRADEQELPELPMAVQQRCGMILCRDGAHVFALAAAARVPPRGVRHVAAKYGKFCYSTRFGFSVPSACDTLEGAAPDSALALSESGDGQFRTRRESDDVEISPARIVSHWKAWPDVLVTTWLVPIPPWHVRIHRVRTARSLTAVEGGFAVGLGGDERAWREERRSASGESVCVRTELGVSAIADLAGGRAAHAVRTDPNTNVLFSRAVLPTLDAQLPPGEHWLACAVVATTATEAAKQLAGAWPTFARTERGFEVRDHRGLSVLTESVLPA